MSNIPSNSFPERSAVQSPTSNSVVESSMEESASLSEDSTEFRTQDEAHRAFSTLHQDFQVKQTCNVPVIKKYRKAIFELRVISSKFLKLDSLDLLEQKILTMMTAYFERIKEIFAQCGTGDPNQRSIETVQSCLQQCIDEVQGVLLSLRSLPPASSSMVSSTFENVGKKGSLDDQYECANPEQRFLETLSEVLVQIWSKSGEWSAKTKSDSLQTALNAIQTPLQNCIGMFEDLLRQVDAKSNESEMSDSSSFSSTAADSRTHFLASDRGPEQSLTVPLRQALSHSSFGLVEQQGVDSAWRISEGGQIKLPPNFVQLVLQEAGELAKMAGIDEKVMESFVKKSICVPLDSLTKATLYLTSFVGLLSNFISSRGINIRDTRIPALVKAWLQQLVAPNSDQALPVQRVSKRSPNLEEATCSPAELSLLLPPSFDEIEPINEEEIMQGMLNYWGLVNQRICAIVGYEKIQDPFSEKIILAISETLGQCSQELGRLCALHGLSPSPECVEGSALSLYTMNPPQTDAGRLDVLRTAFLLIEGDTSILCVGLPERAEGLKVMDTIVRDHVSRCLMLLRTPRQKESVGFLPSAAKGGGT